MADTSDAATAPHPQPIQVWISASSPLAAYLREMAAMGLWGIGPRDVALALIEEGARRALEKQMIPRKFFPVED